jgi:hypothetical protein
MSARSPADHHPITSTLKARVEALQAELTKVEASAVDHRRTSSANASARSAHNGAAPSDGRYPCSQEAALLPVRHPGGRVGCNRSSKPVAQCIPAAGRLSMRGSSAQGLPAFRFKPELGRVFAAKCLICLVGAPRFELGTPSPPDCGQAFHGVSSTGK